jgi:hypothetical protein
MTEIRSDDYLGRKTLILGDVNTGKTTLTRGILEALCGLGLGGRIAVLDMAPDIPEGLAREKGLAGVAGRLIPPAGRDVLYLGGRFAAPRLSSKTEAEAMRKAQGNREAIEGLLRRLDREPREILLINDISIYLQAGEAGGIIPWIDRATTVVANGYWGERLGGGELTLREKAQMQRLRHYFEQRGRVRLAESY